MFLLDRSPRWPSWRQLGTSLALVASLGASGHVLAKEGPAGSQDTVALSALPQEAQHSYQLILAGGPFPFSKDGIVFGNRERILPKRSRGFYHEYTVKTPGSRDRGARRIVCGGQPPNNPEVCYYSDDHYASFRKIAP